MKFPAGKNSSRDNIGYINIFQVGSIVLLIKAKKFIDASGSFGHVIPEIFGQIS